MKLFLTIATVLALSVPAYADPAAVGETALYPPGNEVLACDTFDQVDAIAKAADMVAVFAQFNAIKDAHGEPTCVITPTAGTVKTIIQLDAIELNGTTYNGWEVELTTTRPGFSFWILHMEAIGPQTPARFSGALPDGTVWA